MKSKKIYLILPILTSIFCFLSLANLQKKELDHQLKFKHLIEQNLVRPLAVWKARFSVCENYNPKKCQNFDETYEVDLGSQSSIQSLFSRRPPSSNKVILFYAMTFADDAWLREKNLASLVIPSAQAIWLGITFETISQSGYGLLRDYIFTLPGRTSDSSDQPIEMQIVFSENWQRFGPLLHPPSLSELSSIQDLTGLYQTYRMESELNRQIDTIVSALFSAVAFVLDHTPEASTLSVYGGLRALRSLLYQFSNNQAELKPMTEYLAFGLNAGALLSLAIFLFQICQIKLNRVQKTVLIIACFLPLLACKELVSQSFQKLDLITDGISGLLLIAASVTFFKKSKLKNKEKKAWLVLIQGTLLLMAGYLTLTVNLKDYSSLINLGTKSFVDPRHLLFFPSLVALLFLDMGTVVNTINRVSAIVRQKALLDRDLEISSSVQQATMPPKRGQTANFSWRVIYRPAATIGGDWHDIREIETKNGKKYLVAIVADVTGHGISAALLTTAIASQWGIWCEEMSSQTLANPADIEESLGDAVSKIHRGLRALRQHQGTSLCVLIIGEKGDVCFINAGHPGPLIADSTLTYLSAPSPKPGLLGETPIWRGQTYVPPQEDVTYIAYTDGIHPEGLGVSQWVKQLKSSIEKDKKTIKSILAENILSRWRAMRRKKAFDDDITLIIVERLKNQH